MLPTQPRANGDFTGTQQDFLCQDVGTTYTKKKKKYSTLNTGKTRKYQVLPCHGAPVP